MNTNRHVKNECIAAEYCVPYLDDEETCLDIAEQVIDENQVHDIESWRLANECNGSKSPPDKINKNTFVSNINVEETYHDEVNVLNLSEHDSPQVMVDAPATCDCNCYEYVSNFQKMLNNQINKQLKQIRQQCKQKSKLDDIIDFQLLTQSVKERPVLWNKFLYIYKDKIGQTVAWQELCQILKEDFEEMAREDPEHLDQPQSTATDITLLRDDEWTSPNLEDPALDENSCDLLESTSVCLSTDEFIPQTKFEYEDLTNSRSSCTFERVIGKIESSSTRYQLLPSDDEENPRKILSENENNNCANRIYEKKLKDRNYCYYCELPVLNFARHVVKTHKDEEEVQRIISKPKKSKHRIELLTRLRKKGNYLKSSGRSKPMKTSPLGTATLYVPCPYCLGFYSSKQLWRHKRKCDEKPTSKANTNCEDPSFAKSTRVHADLRKKVFPRMRPDRITVVGQMDHVICEFGARYFRLHRKPHYVHVTSRKMRELSRLLIEIMKMESSVTSMMDVLQPQHYDTIIRATKKISRYDSENKCFRTPTIAMNISTYMKQCCDIAVEYATENFTKEVALESITGIKILASIIEENWRYDLFGEASDDLKAKEKSLEPKMKDEICSNLEGKTAPCNKEQYSDQRIIETRDNSDENYVGVISSKGSVQSNENHECIANGAQESKKKKVIQRTAWTSEQKKLVQSYFKLHIQSRKPPKRRECDALIAENEELLRNKDWLKIKVFIQNVYTNKYKK